MSLEKSLEILREFIEAKRKITSLTREDVKEMEAHFRQEYESKIIQSFSSQLQQFDESFENIYLAKLNIDETPDRYFSIEVLRRLKSSEINSREPLENMVTQDWLKQVRKDEKVRDEWLGKIAEIIRYLGHDPNTMDLFKAMAMCRRHPYTLVPIPDASMDIETYEDLGGLDEIKSGGIDGGEGGWDDEALELAESSCYANISIFRPKEKENYQQGYALLGINNKWGYKIKYLSAEVPKLSKKSKEYLEFEKI